MSRFYMNVDELTDEEVIYELRLRVGPNASLQYGNGRRVLRSWLRSEGPDELLTNRTMSEEYWVIPEALQHVEQELRTARWRACKSRLIHYYRRLWRCKAKTQDESMNRLVLMDKTRKLMMHYFQQDLAQMYPASPQVEVPSQVPLPASPDASTAVSTEVPATSTVENTSYSERYPASAWSRTPVSRQSRNASVTQPNNSGPSVSESSTSTSSGGSIEHSLNVAATSAADTPSSTMAIGSARVPASVPERVAIATSRGPAAEVADQAEQLAQAKHILEQSLREINQQEQALYSQQQSTGSTGTTFGQFQHWGGNLPMTTTSRPGMNTEPYLTSSTGQAWNRFGPRIQPQPTTSVQPSRVSTTTSTTTQSSLSPPLSRMYSHNPGTATSSVNPWSIPFAGFGLLNPRRAELGASMTEQRPENSSQGQQRAANIPLDYVHASEIEGYVRSYVQNLLNPAGGRPIVRNTIVNNLAQQIAEVGLRDPEVSTIDQGRNRFSATIPAGALRVSSEPPIYNPDVTPFARPPGIGTQSTPTLFNDQRDFMFTSREQDPQGDHGHDPANPLPPQDPEWNNARPLYLERRRLPHQTCNIIEKWPKFAGDANPVPVIDFLMEIDVMCRSYHVSKEELRTHAHLLFKEDAYVWYTAYERRFDSWDTLLYQLRLRYDNPNRDRVTKEEMKNRKQRPNERFSAFLTDIEKMCQRLMRPMSESEKFELVAENMKMSYKRRLVPFTITSIDELQDVCFRFDALEGLLQNPPAKQRTNLINEVMLDGEMMLQEEYEEEVDLDAIQAGRGAAQRFRRMDPGVQPTCWNCRRTGHLWRDCEQQKEIFCHICGNRGTTAFKCPQQHNIRSVEPTGSKNE